jgi:hypothetical protein
METEDNKAMNLGNSLRNNKTKVKDIFGILKGKLKRDTDELLKEVDNDFEFMASVEFVKK